jgi:formate hydrogenlyase subunit 3/multisubunit Na+/H+ antiporter MnhD subunit
VTLAGALLVASVATPLLVAAVVAVLGRRVRPLDVAVLGPIPGLVAALVAPLGTTVTFPWPMRIVLALDAPGAALLGGAALLWMLAALYARRYLADDPRASRFVVWWLMTQAGSLGTFLVADVASFYLVFSLASLAATVLVSHEATARARRAGAIYLALAVVGEAALLLAFVMLSSGAGGNPLIADAVARLPASPGEPVIVALLVVGFGLKMGLVPLHVWMPIAHPVAPMPASAVLSGIIVKAGVIGLVRFLPLGDGAAATGAVLMAAGLVTAYYAVAVGLTQRHPKTVLAYSTVSQMGFTAVVIGAGLAAGAPSTGAVAAFYALNHLLVKGALFLGVGVATGGRHRGLVLAAMAVLALSLAGLPLTGGTLAKYAAKLLIGEGTAGLLATLAAAGSTMLMLRFLSLLAASSGAAGEGPPRGLIGPWAAASLAALVLPWLVMAALTGASPALALAPASLWAAAWPIGLGAVLLAILGRRIDRLPAVPEGDVVVLAEAGSTAVRRAGRTIETADAVLREWPAGAAALLVTALAVALVLGLAR